MKGRPDERAFVEAYDRYADAIFRYCYFRVRDRERAKDLMHDAFAKTWAYLVAGNAIENLQAFLYKVAHNASVNEAVKSKALSLDALQEEGGYDPEERALPSPEESAEGALLMRNLEALDDASREVLALRYVSGLPVAEVARVLGVAPNAASVRIHRALAKLREKIT